MSDDLQHFGVAALSICEALLLALKESGTLPESEIFGALKDAATTHENAATAAESTSERRLHMAVASLINGILVEEGRG